MDEKQVKQRIRQVREELNIPAGQLAEQMGVSRRALYSLEKGKTRILNETFERFAKAAGVSEAKLVFDLDPDEIESDVVKSLRSKLESAQERIAALEAAMNEKTTLVNALQGEIAARSETLRAKDQIIKMLEKRLEELSSE